MLCEWLVENPGVWLRGHKLYKFKRQAWAKKGDEMGVPGTKLEGWFKTMRDVFVKLNKKKSGQCRKVLTHREQWIMGHFSFYQQQIKASQPQSQPMSSLARSAPASVPVEEQEQVPDEQEPGPSGGAAADDQPPVSRQSSLERLEAANIEEGRRARKGTSRQQQRMQDEAEDSSMARLLDSMKDTANLLTELVHGRTKGGREPFVSYVGDTLRTCSEPEFATLKEGITTLLNRTIAVAPAVAPAPQPDQPPATLPDIRPGQSQSAPPVTTITAPVFDHQHYFPVYSQQSQQSQQSQPVFPPHSHFNQPYYQPPQMPQSPAPQHFMPFHQGSSASATQTNFQFIRPDPINPMRRDSQDSSQTTFTELLNASMNPGDSLPQLNLSAGSLLGTSATSARLLQTSQPSNSALNTPPAPNTSQEHQDSDADDEAS